MLHAPCRKIDTENRVHLCHFSLLETYVGTSCRLCRLPHQIRTLRTMYANCQPNTLQVVRCCVSYFILYICRPTIAVYCFTCAKNKEVIYVEYGIPHCAAPTAQSVRSFFVPLFGFVSIFFFFFSFFRYISRYAHTHELVQNVQCRRMDPDRGMRTTQNVKVC